MSDHLAGQQDDQTRWFGERYARLRDNVALVIHGKPEVIDTALTALLSEGHLLLEDVPGVGKTTLARALALSIDCKWSRIQFTPDLLPSDITGVQIPDQHGRFTFHPGPVFANVVLADEINRASPKTQSALLEVMEERQVTVDGVTHEVPRPFIVIATQNPIDLDGTYRLPEAQMDRFLMKTQVGYPAPEAEVDVVGSRIAGSPLDTIRPVTSAEEVRAMIAVARRHVRIDPLVQRYAVDVVTHTRTSSGDVRLGVSPRGSIAVLRAAQVWSAIRGRAFVAPDDVKAVAQSTLAHRVILTPEAELGGMTGADVIDTALRTVPQPTSRG